jgi:hypothetical protein
VYISSDYMKSCSVGCDYCLQGCASYEVHIAVSFACGLKATEFSLVHVKCGV